MSKYTFTFIGRKSGAIGIRYKIKETIVAASQKKAAMMLYDRYEHIDILAVKKEKI